MSKDEQNLILNQETNVDKINISILLKGKARNKGKFIAEGLGEKWKKYITEDLEESNEKDEKYSLTGKTSNGRLRIQEARYGRRIDIEILINNTNETP